MIRVGETGVLAADLLRLMNEEHSCGSGKSHSEAVKLLPHRKQWEPRRRKSSTACIGARLSWLNQISMIVRCDFRLIFGAAAAAKQGHFVESGMSHIIYKFSDYFEYPSGDFRLVGHRGYVMASVVSDDGRHLYTGSFDKSIVQWDLLSGGMSQKWDAHSKSIRSLDVCKNTLVSGSNDRTVRVWDCYSKQMKHECIGHSDAVTSVRLNRNGSSLISCSDDRTLRLWSVKVGICLSVFRGHSQSVRSAVFIGDIVVSASQDKSIRVWNPISGECERSRTQIRSSDVFGMVMNCDCTILAYNCHKIELFKWPELTRIEGVDEYSISVCFHPLIPNILAVGTCDDESVKLLDVSKGEIIRKFVGHSDSVRDLCFTADGSRLISVSDDKSVRVWDLTGLPLSV